ncbi:MAG: hypothetical protein HPPSJP_4130 [Candidatus Hepatoplasma scabrum]|nr:MAG: hypothetical protein HPPSJP_4130 [Candidatus Hepatoplasma sp.]
MSKNSLILLAKGDVEIAAQIFNYDQIREIRADLKKFEVKILMNYDEAYYRVFSVKIKDESDEEMKRAEDAVIKFHTNLVNASMKLTPEEIKQIQKSQQNQENQQQANAKNK